MVDCVGVRVATAEEEECGREGFASGDVNGAFLDKAAEGGNAGAGANHDEGSVLRFGREVEGGSAGLVIGDEAIAGEERGEIRGGDAEERLRFIGERWRGQDGEGE